MLFQSFDAQRTLPEVYSGSLVGKLAWLGEDVVARISEMTSSLVSMRYRRNGRDEILQMTLEGFAEAFKRRDLRLLAVSDGQVYLAQA